MEKTTRGGLFLMDVVKHREYPDLIVDSFLWYEAEEQKPKKQKCKKCKKPNSQCNCNYRGKGRPESE
jgi:hypothetical protein